MTTSLRRSRNQGLLRHLRLCLGVAVLLPVALPASAQQPPGHGPLRPGDIIVVTHVYDQDLDGGTLVKIDAATGAETTLSDFSDPSQGPVAIPSSGPPPHFAARLLVEDATSVLVSHSLFGTALLQVDPATGVRTIIAEGADRVAPPVIEHSGDLLIGSEPALVRVDRYTGARTIVSDFQDPAQGPVAEHLRVVAVEESGQIIALGYDGTSVLSTFYKLFRVDPSDGTRTLLSDFADPAQGPAPRFMGPLVLDLSGYILLFDWDTARRGLFRIDPVTGARARLSAPCFEGPTFGAVALSASIDERGDLLVVVGADQPFPHSLIRMDAATGQCVSVRASTETASAVPTPLVNGMVSLSVRGTAVATKADDPYAPTGVLTISATFTNETSTALRNPFFRVAELSGGNTLISGDRLPDLIREGGKGTRQTPDVGNDGVLSPGESVDVEFGIGLQTRHPFTFFVNVFGEPAAAQ
ncbi:MAG TPA: hypothetical protein VFV95_12265 [Vicinamibacterales bacterium]|nr:hypothetical protein [Vicinamibacterales bacterium]